MKAMGKIYRKAADKSALQTASRSNLVGSRGSQRSESAKPRLSMMARNRTLTPNNRRSKNIK